MGKSIFSILIFFSIIGNGFMLWIFSNLIIYDKYTIQEPNALILLFEWLVALIIFLINLVLFVILAIRKDKKG